MDARSLAVRLERLYADENRTELVHPDPLAFVLATRTRRDREVVGLLASALAYGRVAQIHRSIARVLAILGPSPHGVLLETSPRSLSARLRGFRHRFTTGRDVAALLSGTRHALERHGSLRAAFEAGRDPADEDVVPALTQFVRTLNGPVRTKPGGFSLVPSPEDGSACKRLQLYLRWMLRRDGVDPGVWGHRPRQLLVPIDTHLHRAGLLFGFTTRRQADLVTAREITRGFRALSPADPVRYDFVLTRLGVTGRLEAFATGATG